MFEKHWVNDRCLEIEIDAHSRLPIGVRVERTVDRATYGFARTGGHFDFLGVVEINDVFGGRANVGYTRANQGLIPLQCGPPVHAGGFSFRRRPTLCSETLRIPNRPRTAVTVRLSVSDMIVMVFPASTISRSWLSSSGSQGRLP
jgi:hypothetical protein